MSNVVIDRTKLDYLANAIAHKASVSIPLTLSAMVSAVDAMSVSLQHISKSYTPSTSAITETFTPSVGFDGIGQLDISIASMQILSGQESITGMFFTEGGQRKWTAMADFQTSDFSGWMDGANSAILHGYKTYSAVSKNVSVTPSTVSQTIGGANVMMESAVTINPIPSSYIIPSGTLSISASGTYDVASFASAEVTVSGGGGGSDSRFLELITRKISGTVDESTINAVGSYAFYKCTKLNSVSMSGVTSIYEDAFCMCSVLGSISFPNATYIGSSAFYSTNIHSADFPKVTTIKEYAFYACSQLSSISITSTIDIGSSAFNGCTKLQIVKADSVQTIYNSAFYNCTSLTQLSFSRATAIHANAFRGCTRLVSLYLLGSSIPALMSSSNVFNSTPIGGYTTQTGGVYGSIFVPSSLFASYKTANNWSRYSNRFVSV